MTNGKGERGYMQGMPRSTPEAGQPTKARTLDQGEGRPTRSGPPPLCIECGERPRTGRFRRCRPCMVWLWSLASRKGYRRRKIKENAI
jgi:hypothetical protein